MQQTPARAWGRGGPHSPELAYQARAAGQRLGSLLTLLSQGKVLGAADKLLLWTTCWIRRLIILTQYSDSLVRWVFLAALYE